MILSLAERVLILFGVAQAFLLGTAVGYIFGRYGCGNGRNLIKEQTSTRLEEMLDDHH